jgi:hypothetical protein
MTPDDRERWRRIEAICDAALRLDGAARETFLAGACGADIDVRLFPAAFTDQRTMIVAELPPTDEFFLSQLTIGHQPPLAKLPIAANLPRSPSLSPDGRWIAFTASRPRSQIYIQRYPPAGEPRQVTVDGGRDPSGAETGAACSIVPAHRCSR